MPETISTGGCAILRWAVEGVQAVYLSDGSHEVGVTGHEQRQVCPTTKTTYTLRVVANNATHLYHVTLLVQTPTPTPTATVTPKVSPSPTPTRTATPTLTPVPTQTPTVAFTPTFTSTAVAATKTALPATIVPTQSAPTPLPVQPKSKRSSSAPTLKQLLAYLAFLFMLGVLLAVAALFFWRRD